MARGQTNGKLVAQLRAQAIANGKEPQARIVNLVSIKDGFIREMVDDGVADERGTPGVRRQMLLGLMAKTVDGERVFYAADEPFSVYDGRVGYAPVCPKMGPAEEETMRQNMAARLAAHEALKAKTVEKDILHSQRTAAEIAGAFAALKVDADIEAEAAPKPKRGRPPKGEANAN